MKDLQYITNSSPSFIEGLYQDFVKDPQSIDPEFKKFFEGFDFALSQGKNGNGNGTATTVSKEPVFKTTDGVDWKKELGAYRLILGYRNKGHLLAKTNPIRPEKTGALTSIWGFLDLPKQTSTNRFRRATSSDWAPPPCAIFCSILQNAMRRM